MFQAAGGLAGLGERGPLTFDAELPLLLGSGVLFAGVLVLARLVRAYAPDGPSMRTARIASWVQGLHVLEHLALVLSFLCVGRFAGISTLLGLVEPGQFVGTYWIWWHASANLALTLLALHAGWRFRAERSEASAPQLDSVVRTLKQVKPATVVAALVRWTSGLATVVLAGNIAFVVLGANPGNSVVATSGRLADGLVLFFKDLFVLTDPKVNVAVNYGLAAVAYFAVGRVFAIRRRSRTAY